MDLCFVHEENVTSREQEQYIAIDLVKTLLQFQDFLLNTPQQVGKGERFGRAIVDQQFTLDLGKPHTEKFVHVVGKNAKKPGSLNDRNVFICRFLQHALVERQPTDLFIDKFIVIFHGLSAF